MSGLARLASLARTEPFAFCGRRKNRCSFSEKGRNTTRGRLLRFTGGPCHLAMNTIVQISLDVISIPEALDTARAAIRSGVDWLEAGTPLIIAEGMNGVRALRDEFPDVPIVADLKTMDGGLA